MMSGHLSITRFLSAILLLDIILIALVSFNGTHADAVLSSLLPGRFGPGMGVHMTGNQLLGALIVQLNALLFLAAGFVILLAASRRVLMVGPGGVWRLLYGTAAQSREDIAAASFAVAEEQKAEIRRLHTGRNLVGIGAVLLLLAFPALCFTYAQADAQGAPLLQDAGGPVANGALTVSDTALFAADQFLDAVLLDVPRVFDLHVSPLRTGDGHAWLRPFVLLYHILAKLIALALLFAAWRDAKLRVYVQQMAGLEAVPALVAATAMAAVQQPANDRHPPGMLEQSEPEATPREPVRDVEEQEAPALLALSIPEVPVEPSPPEELHPELLTETAAPPGETAPEPVQQDDGPETPFPLQVSAPEVPLPIEPDHTEEAHPELLTETAAPLAETALEDVEEHPSESLAVAYAEATDEPAPEIPPPSETRPSEIPVRIESHLPEEPFHSDAPLALHELKNPGEVIEAPAADGNEPAEEEHRVLPYKRTALHVQPEFDA